MISREVYESIPNMKLLKPPETVNDLEGVVMGSKLDIIGVICVPIKLGPYLSKNHSILVANGTRNSCIIGMDFLDRFYISIDTTNRRLRISPPESEPSFVSISPSFLPTEDIYKVVNNAKVELSTRSVHCIEVRVRDLGQDLDGCIESISLDNQNFMLPRSLHTIRDGLTFIECINVTDTPIILQKNQNVGSFTPMDQLNVINCDESKNSGVLPVFSDSNVSDFFDLSNTDLTARQKTLVHEFLNRNSSVIGTSDVDLGLTGTIKHHIEIENSGPIKQRYRRFPEPLKGEIQSEVDKLLARGIVEPSESSWASPLVPVRKKNGKLRLCIDYRAVNACTRRDSFPLPHINDAISKFKGCVYFSSLDLLSGYHQIAMEESSKEITAFSTGENLYQFTRMPFGITNGPASFSRLVAIVLSGIPFHVAQAYLDDILVSGQNFEDHLRNLESIFSRLDSHGLKLSAQKCSLFQSEVDYLGHLVGRNGIKPLQKNVQAIIDYPRPTTVKQLRTFTGMINFYKRFLYRAEIIMKPLYGATAGKLLTWTPECEKAFTDAKNALTSAPILSYPDFDETCTFYVTCDASGSGAGAVLSQLQGVDEKVIAYAGTSFNDAQLRYSPTDRELAAIRFAVNYFKPYLYGRHFVIRTDHEPLLYLYRMKRFDDRLHRTMEDLNIGHFEFQYLPGKYNTVADALSRANYPWKLPPDEDSRVCWDPVFSLDQYDVVQVPGGADSIFNALSLLLHGDCSRSVDIREGMVDKMSADPAKYGYATNAKGRREMELLRDPEIFPSFGTLQAIVDSLEIGLFVYFSKGPMISLHCDGEPVRMLHIKCSGGVHFDALREKSPGVEAPNPCEGKVELDVNSVYQINDATAVLSRSSITLSSSTDDLKFVQANDSEIAQLVAIVKSKGKNVKLELKGCMSIFRTKFHKLSINSGELLVFETVDKKYIPVIPQSCLRNLAEELHEVLSHAGRDKTIAVMHSKFYHPKFPSIITEVVRKCMACQCHEGKIARKYPVHRRNVDFAYEILAVDLMELPLSKSGYKCVLVGIDLFSKFAHVVPLRNKKSAPVARALESSILASVPRTPKTILSDNGPEFRGAPFEKMLDGYGIGHEFSVPYAACTNGGVERFNQTLRSRLATVCNEDS